MPGQFQLGPYFSGLRIVQSLESNRFSHFAYRDVPNASQLPAAGISWRMAAVYCNWLHNGKSNDASSLLTGAYDTSTWSPIGNTPVTDQTTRLPNARYFIPSLDQWFRASFFDPNRFGLGQAGWWSRVNARESIPVAGYPGETDSQGRPAETTFGRSDPAFPDTNYNAWDVPLAAFPNAQSPWGLLDTIGGGSEWTEERQPNSFSGAIAAAGLSATNSLGGNSQYPLADFGSQWWWMNYTSTWGRFDTSLRIATTIPSQGPGFLLMVCSLHFVQRRPRL